MEGRVKFFDKKKGWGIIRAIGNVDDKTNEIFVHYTDIKKDGFKELLDNQPVEFEIGQGRKGLKAINVIPA
jgi:cold shock protein